MSGFILTVSQTIWITVNGQFVEASEGNQEKTFVSAKFAAGIKGNKSKKTSQQFFDSKSKKNYESKERIRAKVGSENDEPKDVDLYVLPRDCHVESTVVLSTGLASRLRPPTMASEYHQTNPLESNTIVRTEPDDNFLPEESHYSLHSDKSERFSAEHSTPRPTHPTNLASQSSDTPAATSSSHIGYDLSYYDQ